MNNQNKTKTETLVLVRPISFYLCVLAAVFSTILLSHQQIIVGTVVNLMLLSGAVNLKRNEQIPLAIFPSILAVFQGLLFGKFITAVLFTNIQLVPKIFLTAMGILQLVTSLLGGGLFLLISKLEKK